MEKTLLKYLIYIPVCKLQQSICPAVVTIPRKFK